MPNSIGYPSGTTPSGSVPHIWSKKMALTLDAAAVVLQLCNRSVEGEIASFGDTVHVNKAGNITVGNYTIGTDTADTTYSLTDQLLTLDQQKQFSVLLDDIEKAVSIHDLAKQIADRGMVAMAQTMDDRAISHYADATNAIGSVLAPIMLTKDNVYDYFLAAHQKLLESNLTDEQLASASAVVDPATFTLIKKSPYYVQATQTGDAVVRKGKVDDFAGFTVVRSNRIATVTGTKPLMFFTKDFISFAVRINPKSVETLRADKQFGDRIRALALYGSKVFNPGCGVTLYSAV